MEIYTCVEMESLHVLKYAELKNPVCLEMMNLHGSIWKIHMCRNGKSSYLEMKNQLTTVKTFHTQKWKVLFEKWWGKKPCLEAEILSVQKLKPQESRKCCRIIASDSVHLPRSTIPLYRYISFATDGGETGNKNGIEG